MRQTHLLTSPPYVCEADTRTVTLISTTNTAMVILPAPFPITTPKITPSHSALYRISDSNRNVMTHAQKPDLVFQRNERVHLNWRGASVQSTTGSRGVRISGSNAGYTVFRGRVQDYWLPTPLACFPFTSPTVRHRVPSGFN